jgi:hypothetical protein
MKTKRQMAYALAKSPLSPVNYGVDRKDVIEFEQLFNLPDWLLKELYNQLKIAEQAEQQEFYPDTDDF